MKKTTKLTKAVLLAMGATGTAMAGTVNFDTDSSLELPMPGSIEYGAAAAEDAWDAATTTTTKKKTKKKAKRKTKKKAKKKNCTNPQGKYVPCSRGNPPD